MRSVQSPAFERIEFHRLATASCSTIITANHLPIPQAVSMHLRSLPHCLSISPITAVKKGAVLSSSYLLTLILATPPSAYALRLKSGAR